MSAKKSSTMLDCVLCFVVYCIWIFLSVYSNLFKVEFDMVSTRQRFRPQCVTERLGSNQLIFLQTESYISFNGGLHPKNGTSVSIMWGRGLHKKMPILEGGVSWFFGIVWAFLGFLPQYHRCHGCAVFRERYVNLDSLFIGSEMKLTADKTHLGIVNREIYPRRKA